MGRLIHKFLWRFSKAYRSRQLKRHYRDLLSRLYVEVGPQPKVEFDYSPISTRHKKILEENWKLTE